jgi:rhodanese-related sulfurtransferase
LEQQFGFTNLANLQGGIMAWSQEIDPSMQVY